MKQEKDQEIVSESVLAYYGIYPNERRTLPEKIKEECKKIVEHIRNEVEAEQIYLYGPILYKNKGRRKARYDIFFVVDTHYLNLEYLYEICRKLQNSYPRKNIDISFKATTLAAFEKRNQLATEEEYDIKKYGRKIFDSGKELKILPKYVPLKYQLLMEHYRYAKIHLNYIDEIVPILIKMYIQKKGYLQLNYGYDAIAEYKPFIAEITQDDYVINVIDKLLDSKTTKEDIKETVYQFENYVQKMKAVKLNKVKIEKQVGRPSKKVKKETLKIEGLKLIKYKAFIKEKKQEGSLDWSQIKKTDLYELYIEEKVPIHFIALLYEIEDKQVREQLKKWNICYTQTIISNPEFMKNILDKEELNERYDFLEEFLRRKMGIPKFRDLVLPILELLKTQKVHPISEIWELTENNDYIPLQQELRFCIAEKQPMLYYRANWCLNILLRVGLVEEINHRYYQITNRGMEFYIFCQEEKIDTITIKMLQNRYLDYKVETEIKKPSKKIKYQSYLLPENTNKIEKIDVKNVMCKIVEIEEESLKKKLENKKKKQAQKGKRIIVTKVNHLEMNKNKKLLGDKCEEIIYEREKHLLEELGRKDLADKVIWVARDVGDGLGYDIKSFKNIKGKYEEIYIEVKGTSGSCESDFEITENEIEFSRDNPDRYYLYRLGKIYSESPELRIKKGNVAENYQLKPVKYIAQIKE